MNTTTINAQFNWFTVDELRVIILEQCYSDIETHFVHIT